MPASLMPMPKQAFYGLVNGVHGPIVGGKVYTYEAGTLTPKDTYTTAAGNVANPNPVILDARGEASVWLGFGAYDIVLKGADDALIWTQESVDRSLSAALVGFVQAGSGAAPRTAQAKLREIVSVTDFGAVGDGATSDQTAVAAAVDHCYSTGDDLYWPDGTYLTTASIPNLHNVRHLGPGVVKRGSDLFYVQPKNTNVNRLYVATTGDDGNDGLSASQPHLTINGALNRLKGYGQGLNGDWRIILAAGTYAPCTVPAGLAPRNYIRIWGPSVGGHPNVPTAIIDGDGASNVNCLIASEHHRIDVRDIKLQNGTGTLSIGLAATMFCDVYTNNVHTDNIYSGIQVTQNSRLRQTGGVHTPGANGQIGVAVGVSSSMSIGYKAGGFGKGPKFNGAFYQAIKITENTTGHVDYCVIDGADVGIELSQNCRVNDIENDIKNCTVAAIRATQSCYANNKNTFTSNATNFIHNAHSVHLPIATGSQGVLRVGRVTSSITHTGTTAKTILATPFTIPAGYFTDNSKTLRTTIRGKFTSSGDIQVGVDLGGSAFTVLASSGATSDTQFEAVIDIDATGVADQDYYERLIQATAVARHASGTRTIDMSTARGVQIVGTLPATGDKLVIESVDIELVG